MDRETDGLYFLGSQRGEPERGHSSVAQSSLTLCDLIKPKTCFAARDTISKLKIIPSEWEKIIANETADKRLICKIYTQLKQLNTKRKIQKVGKSKVGEININRHFFKEDIQKANKHMKRWLISLIVREMHIKITRRYHPKPARILIFKKSTKINTGEAVK